MTLTFIIRLALDVSIGLVVFTLGLRASFADAAYLFRRPKMYLRSILSMNIVMPVFAVVLVSLFELHPATKIALVALALSPVPPMMPKKQTEAGGSAPYALGLLVATAATSILLVPIALTVLDLLFNLGLKMPVDAVASIVLTTMVGPLAAGIAVRWLAPEFAARIAGPLSSAATILLLSATLPLLIALWPQLQAMIGNGTLAAMALFAFVGLAVGHVLGGPEEDERAVLALATAARHPGLAIAIASINFPDEKGVIAAVIWHLIVGGLFALVYIRLIRRPQPKQSSINKQTFAKK